MRVSNRSKRAFLARKDELREILEEHSLQKRLSEIRKKTPPAELEPTIDFRSSLEQNLENLERKEALLKAMLYIYRLKNSYKEAAKTEKELSSIKSIKKNYSKLKRSFS